VRKVARERLRASRSSAECFESGRTADFETNIAQLQNWRVGLV
jgi:hypothetical protein